MRFKSGQGKNTNGPEQRKPIPLHAKKEEDAKKSIAVPQKTIAMS